MTPTENPDDLPGPAIMLAVWAAVVVAAVLIGLLIWAAVTS